MVVSELDIGNAAVEVHFTETLVGALRPKHEDGETTFGGVVMEIGATVLASAVVHGAVAQSWGSETPVNSRCTRSAMGRRAMPSLSIRGQVSAEKRFV